jgi:maltooligosyltrehalose synthase
VPYERHQGYLQALLDHPDNTSDTYWRDLWADRYSGRIKQWLTHQLLQLRQQQPTLFSTGAYTPLTVQGRYAENVLAFLRTHDTTQALIVVPLNTARLAREQGTDPLSLDWADTNVHLPDGLLTPWRSCLTDTGFDAADHYAAGTLFAIMPIACLISSSNL